MKITFVIGNLMGSGAENVLRTLLIHFSKNKDLELSVLLNGDGENIPNMPENIKIYRVKSEGSIILQKIKRLRLIRKYVKKLNTDIVVGFGIFSSIDVLEALLFSGVPVVACERVDPRVSPHRKVARFQRTLLFPFAKGIVFQTPDSKDFFSKSIQKKGIIIPNPIMIEKVEQRNENEKTKSIVTVGRLDNKHKNQILLIKAFAKISEEFPEYKLIIYGEGTDRELYEREIAQHNITDKVQMPGSVENPSEYIKRAELFVLSSNYEGMPNALIEAMAVGLPCISTDCIGGGAKYLIKNNENGILIPINDEQKLVEEIRRLLTNKEDAVRLGNNAYEINEVLSLDIIANMWIDYLNKLVVKS